MPKIMIEFNEADFKYFDSKAVLAGFNTISDYLRALLENNATHDSSLSRKDCGLEGWEKFWAAYPRKDAKAAALKIWTKIKPSDKLLIIILEALEKVKKTKGWVDKKFIPLPSSWLNGRRWEDEIENEKLVASFKRSQWCCEIEDCQKPVTIVVGNGPRYCSEHKKLKVS